MSVRSAVFAITTSAATVNRDRSTTPLQTAQEFCRLANPPAIRPTGYTCMRILNIIAPLDGSKFSVCRSTYRNQISAAFCGHGSAGQAPIMLPALLIQRRIGVERSVHQVHKFAATQIHLQPISRLGEQCSISPRRRMNFRQWLPQVFVRAPARWRTAHRCRDYRAFVRLALQGKIRLHQSAR